MPLVEHRHIMPNKQGIGTEFFCDRPSALFGSPVGHGNFSALRDKTMSMRFTLAPRPRL